MSSLERLKRINARAPAEESVALRVAVCAAVMTAGLAVVTHGVGSPVLTLAAVVGIPGGFWFSHWARYREGFWLKVGLAVAVLAAFASFLGSLTGVEARNLAELQIPLSELFLWVQVLHALDVPARRDLMFSLVSSLVLMGVAGLLSISMDLVPYLAAWSAAAAAALVLAYRSELAELPGLDPAAVAPRRSPSRRRLAPVRAVAGAVGATVVLVAAVGGAMFLVVPPAGGARALSYPRRLPAAIPVPEAGGLSNPTLGASVPGGAAGESRRGRRSGRASFGYLGFSTSLDTAARGRPDETLVMRVRATRPDLWRGQTFDVWDGRRWSISDSRPRVLYGRGSLKVPPVPGEERLVPGDDELVQTFYLQRPGPNLIFGANHIATLYFPDERVFQLSDGTLRAGVALEEEAVYTVVSRRPAVTRALLRSADASPEPVPAPVARRYLQLPAVPDRVRDLAVRVTAGAPTTYDKVQALEAWMRAHTRYSLNIPPLPKGADAVEQYLFVDRTGFCEQIGSSLVVMLRSLGIPARLVVGYAPGQRNPFTGLYEVRASDAHAWAEVWFPGLGWQGFDPTASVPLAGEGGVPRASSGLASYLAVRLPRPPPWAVPAAVAVALVLIAAAAVARARAGWRTRRRRPRRSWADACLARLETAGAAHGRERRPSETVGEYVAALEDTPLADPRLGHVVDVVTRDAWSGAPAADDERRHVERIIDEITAARSPTG